MHAANPESDVAQSRAARLLIAYLDSPNSFDGALIQSAEVFAELELDQRGATTAFQELVIALAVGLADSWTAKTDRGTILNQLRLGLLEMQGESRG